MKTSVSGGSRVLLFALCLILIAAFFLPGFASADEKVTVDNGLPVVYLNIDESRGTIEDMALYRTLPGAIIFDVTDVPMLHSALKQAKDLPGVKYIRVPRKSSYQVYEDGAEMTVGKAAVSYSAAPPADTRPT